MLYVKCIKYQVNKVDGYGCEREISHQTNPDMDGCGSGRTGWSGVGLKLGSQTNFSNFSNLKRERLCWRVTRPEQGGMGPLVSSKAIVVAENFKRCWKDLVELYRIKSCWFYCFTCDVTRRSNKMKLYWFTVANCLSRKINLPNNMELDKHKDHGSDLGVATCVKPLEDLWRQKKGQYWPIRGQKLPGLI